MKDYLNLICKFFRNLINEGTLSELKIEKIEYQRKINSFKREQMISPYDSNNLL